MPSVAVIYDTSYLMWDRPDGSLHDDLRLRQYDIVNFVFDETLGEIAKHMADPQKRVLAKKARTRVEALKDARTANVRYSQGSLAGVSPFYGKSPLGADSRHDRLLLGKAKAFIENGEHDAVILACNDQGISVDARELREVDARELREAGLPIFFAANARAGRETLIDLYERLRFGLSWGRWKPVCVLEVPVSTSTRKLFLAPDGETLAGVDVDERTVRVWEVSHDGSTGYPREIRTERPAVIPVQAQDPRCHYTRQGSFVVTSLDQQGCMVITKFQLPFVTTRSPGAQYSLSSPEAAEQKAEAIWSFSLPKRGSATRSPLAFSPNERFVAAGTDLYDLTTGQLVLSNDLRPQQTNSLAFSADCRLLASGGQDFLRRCGKLTVQDIYSGQRVDVLAPQSKAISVVAFSPTAQFVAAGTLSGDVHVWRLPDLTRLATHSCGDRAAVRSLVFHRDGESLAVGVGRSVALILGPAFTRMAKMDAPAISDGDVLTVNFDTKGQRLLAMQGQAHGALDVKQQCALSLWSFPEGQHLLTFAHAHARWMEPDADGNWAVTADTDNVLRVWRLEGPGGAQRFRQRTMDRNEPTSGGHAQIPTQGEERLHTVPLEENRVWNNAERPARAEQANGETRAQQIVDPIDHFRRALAAASAGDAAAQLEVAKCYFQGRGVDRDPVEGRRWIRQAAEQGFAEAQAELADLYREGREDLPKSNLEAASWYEKAAAQGNAHAQYGLGRISSDCWAGYLPEDAGAWFEKAALQGHADAQKELADLYMFGRGGMARDVVKALGWYRTAAAAGHGPAQYEIGACFLSGRGVEQSDLEAVNWFRKAAAQGVAIAQNDLGWMYEAGRGVPQDHRQAREWYFKSATQGHPLGQRNLGRMLEGGLGGETDLAAGVVWYHKAAEQGDMTAQWMVGYCYLAGIGVAMNRETAAHWFRQAASQGDEESRKMLEELGAS